MQQAVVSTQIPPSTAIAITSFNRHVLRHKLNCFLTALNECIQDLSSYCDSKFNSSHELNENKRHIQKYVNKKLKQNSNGNSIKSILIQLEQDLKKIDTNDPKQMLILDPILEPFFDSTLISKLKKKPTTFYENRFGFAENELLNCEFKEPQRIKKLNILNKQNCSVLSSLIEYRQTRGFKTRRTTTTSGRDDDMGLFNLKNWGSSSTASPAEDNPMKAINSMLSKQSDSSKKLGSIFGNSSSSTSSSSSQNLDKDLESKLKVAFTEGFLYRQARDEKKKNSLFWSRFLFFCIIAYILYNTVSISAVPSNGNGKNGGGINIRALTGNVNFEINPETVSVKFDDVKGLPEAKKELCEIVDFLKDPEKYTKLGARLPKGVLLVGPPGCGKTLLAKSVAGEAGVPFFQASGSDFDEMFVGTGSKRVRQLFAAARAKAPCVIFIDEIDSVGSTRTNSMIHPHANQTINQLLAEMDGFQKNEGVIVLGATNRRETLDSALMRPGRFDVEVRIDKPDVKARTEILEYYLDKVAKDKNVNVDYLARQLTGFSGSSIENVVNQAALRAVVTNSTSVKMEHLEWSLDRTLMGYGKSRLMDEECNRNTAYHEAGHVLVAYFTKDSHPLHKVTILPRAQSLGHTAFVPENDGYSTTKSQMLASMDVAFGGRIAEELAFGNDKVTTGASADFESATNLASQMVKRFGMSDKIGQRVFVGKEEQLSPQLQDVVDQEIKKILQDSYERAKNIIKTHNYELKLIAEALLQHETLDVNQIKNLIENHKM